MQQDSQTMVNEIADYDMKSAGLEDGNMHLAAESRGGMSIVGAACRKGIDCTRDDSGPQDPCLYAKVSHCRPAAPFAEGKH
jgi:hypothetical protein